MTASPVAAADRTRRLISSDRAPTLLRTRAAFIRLGFGWPKLPRGQRHADPDGSAEDVGRVVAAAADHRPVSGQGGGRERDEERRDLLRCARENATSVAVWPDGKEEVTGPGRPSPAAGGRRLPTKGLMPRFATIAAAA